MRNKDVIKYETGRNIVEDITKIYRPANDWL